MGAGLLYRERQNDRVRLLDFSTDLAAGHWRCTASTSTGLMGDTVGEYPASGGPLTILDIFTNDDGAGRVPHQGIQDPGNEPHKPTDLLNTPLHVGHYCDYGGR